jgi:hypothetical protein
MALPVVGPVSVAEMRVRAPTPGMTSGRALEAGTRDPLSSTATADTWYLVPGLRLSTGHCVVEQRTTTHLPLPPVEGHSDTMYWRTVTPSISGGLRVISAVVGLVGGALVRTGALRGGVVKLRELEAGDFEPSTRTPTTRTV